MLLKNFSIRKEQRNCAAQKSEPVLLDRFAGIEIFVGMVKTIVASLCVFLCAVTAALAQVITPISNLNHSTDNVASIYGSVQEAASFTTGNTSNLLLSASISLGGLLPGFGGGTVGQFNLSLYSDASGSPGNNLATLSGNSYPTNAGVYAYTGSHYLAPNTTYWLVASSPQTSLALSYEWNATDSTSLDSGSVWTLGTSKSYSGGWTILNDGGNLYLKSSVTVTTNIQPTISIFQPMVLTYTNSGLSFVLQQNSNLATTNWVNAANAIQISTVNTNQAVFIVPQSGGQIFYRLNLQ
jgi:hypothetical protein